MSRDERLRALEREALAGDLSRGQELDQELRAAGLAADFYARRLLSLIPARWRAPMTFGDGDSPYPSVPWRLSDAETEGLDAAKRHAAIKARQASYAGVNDFVWFVDRPPELRDKSRLGWDATMAKGTNFRFRPYIGVNAPDGFGNPTRELRGKYAAGAYGLRWEGDETAGFGIEVGLALVLKRSRIEQMTDRIETSGSAVLVGRGNPFSYLGPQSDRSYEIQMPRGWSDRSLVEKASSVFRSLERRAAILAPVSAIRVRALELREAFLRSRHGDRWDDVIAARRSKVEFDEMIAEAGHGAPFPWALREPDWTLPRIAATYGPDVIRRWHEVLDGIQARI